MQIPDFLQSNYGTCSKKRCSCNETGWVGTKCVHWQSSNARSYKELSEWQRQYKKQLKACSIAHFNV